VYGLLGDHQGTVRNVIKWLGDRGNTVAYDAFGNITTESSSANTENYGFTDLLFDRRAGNERAGQSVYNPQTGRWMQEDPIRLSAGPTNFKRYVK